MEADFDSFLQTSSVADANLILVALRFQSLGTSRERWMSGVKFLDNCPAPVVHVMARVSKGDIIGGCYLELM